MLASESRTAIEVIDAEGKKHSILRGDIGPDATAPVVMAVTVEFPD